MDNNKPYYISALEQGLKERQGRNPRYSLRRFATYLEIDSSSLSAILKHKRTIPKSKILSFLRQAGA